MSARLTPSIVVGMYVGSDVGWPAVMVTMPSDLTGALTSADGSATATVCARATAAGAAASASQAAQASEVRAAA